MENAGNAECHLCKKPKAHLVCELCAQAMCKKCSEKLLPGSFSFQPTIPPELKHRLYCGRCFDTHVSPALAEYDSLLARARAVMVYEKVQSEETRLMSRHEKPVEVKDCPDRKEALLRLAFLAVLRGFNSLIDVHIVARKVRKSEYQTSAFDGTGIPTQLDPDKLGYQ